MYETYGFNVRHYLRIFSFPILILASQFFLVIFDAYSLVPWIDIPMHFLGGASIAVSFTLFLKDLQRMNQVGSMHPFVEFVIIMAMVSLAATTWEFIEWSVDYLWNLGTQLGLDDTISDLFMGILGGVCALVIKSVKKNT